MLYRLEMVLLYYLLIKSMASVWVPVYYSISPTRHGTWHLDFSSQSNRYIDRRICPTLRSKSYSTIGLRSTGVEISAKTVSTSYWQTVQGLWEVTGGHLLKSQICIRKRVLESSSWLMFAHLYPWHTRPHIRHFFTVHFFLFEDYM
jgi:hypothetical protein